VLFAVAELLVTMVLVFVQQNSPPLLHPHPAAAIVATPFTYHCQKMLNSISIKHSHTVSYLQYIFYADLKYAGCAVTAVYQCTTVSFCMLFKSFFSVVPILL